MENVFDKKTTKKTVPEKTTTTSTSTVTSNSFPEFASSGTGDDAMMALEVANYEAATKKVVKAMTKADQRKGTFLLIKLGG